MDMTRNKISSQLRWWQPVGFVVLMCLLLGGIIRANASAKAQGNGTDLNDSDANRAEGNNASFNEADFNAVDEYISAQMRSTRIPGLSLAIVQGDQIVYLKGFGRADTTGRAVTPQTSF